MRSHRETLTAGNDRPWKPTCHDPLRGLAYDPTSWWAPCLFAISKTFRQELWIPLTYVLWVGVFVAYSPPTDAWREACPTSSWKRATPWVGAGRPSRIPTRPSRHVFCVIACTWDPAYYPPLSSTSPQAFEPNYRWHPDYKLSQRELTRNSADTVRAKVRGVPCLSVTAVSHRLIDRMNE
jgi:hypothetical protein